MSDAELKFLVDSVMYSNILSSKDSQDLAKRLKSLSGKELDNATKYVNPAFGHPLFSAEENKDIDVLNNIMIIANALKSEGTYIKFSFDIYDVNEKTYKVVRKSKSEYIVRPVFTYLNNGRYLMVARFQDSEKEYTFQVEHMSEIKIIEIKDFNPIKQDEKVQDRAKYILQHPFDFGGETCDYNLRISREFFSRAYKAFGYSMRIIPCTVTEKTVDVCVKSSKEGMKRWLLTNYDIAEIIIRKNSKIDEEIQKELFDAIEIFKKNIKNKKNCI